MTHLIDGEFQSDKYPTCPRGKVPLSTKDPMAQDLLWEYAQRRRVVDKEFADDLETALRAKGFVSNAVVWITDREVEIMHEIATGVQTIRDNAGWLFQFSQTCIARLQRLRAISRMRRGDTLR